MKQLTLKQIILFFCVLSSHLAFAEVTTATINGLVYSLSGTRATIINYTSAINPDLVIPESITYDGDTYTVSCIGSRQYGDSKWARTGAFFGCKTLRSIVIPSSVTSIPGDYVYNPDNAPNLDGQVFYGCTNLEKVVFQGSSSIGANAFYGCSALKTLIFDKSVTINECAFWNCTSLKYVVFPKGTSFGPNAFKGCNRLQDVIYLGEDDGRFPGWYYDLGVSNLNLYYAASAIIWEQHSYTYSGKNPAIPSYVNILPRGFIPKLNGSVVLQKDAGTYTADISFTFTNEDMSFTVDIPYNYTVLPAQLTARVKDFTRFYGDPNPQFQTEYTGFVSGENASVITSQGTYTTTATQKSDVGTYEVKQQGATAKNYTFNYESGTLSVRKAPLTMTPRNKTMTYGDRVPNLDVDYAGLKNSESQPVWTTEPSITSTGTSASNAGSYPITISGGVAKNYNVTYNQGTLTINKAPLTITTKNVTREYGDNDPEFEFFYSGLKNGETAPAWAIAPTIVTATTKTSPVGTYSITATGGEARNYQVQYVNTGKLTITKAPLTAKARSYTRKQGEENPAFAVDYIGFKNSETKLALTQEPIATTTANRNSQPGTYPITLSGGLAINYDLSYVDGTLTILLNDNPGFTTDNVLTLDNIVGNKGTQVTLPVGLTNKHSITAVQFDIYLPEGVTIATDSRGKMRIKTTSRMDGTYSVMGSTMDGFTRVVGYSPDTDPFLGGSGNILNITLDVGSNVSIGNYTIRIKDIVLSDINNNEYHPADVGGVLTIKDYTLGDVDNSGAVNINDVVCIINHILNKTNGTFIEEAADVDGSGTININDVVTLINRYILHRTSAPKRALRAAADANGITDKLYIDDISIEQGDTMEIAVQLDNADEVRAVQGNIMLPEGLKFVTRANGRLDVRNLDERSEDFTLSCALQEDGSMTFAHYSPDGFAYMGSEGGIFTFKIEADKNAEPGEYQVDMKDVVISVDGVGYEMPASSSVLIVKKRGEKPDGIGSVSSSELYDVYTVSGVKVRSQAATTAGLPAGIYIMKQGSAKPGGKKVVIK